MKDVLNFLENENDLQKYNQILFFKIIFGMQLYFNPARWKKEDDLNNLKNVVGVVLYQIPNSFFFQL